jgi:hypothetical protein
MCNCDACKSLEVKRAAALAWLGDRYLLAEPVRRPGMIRVSDIVHVTVDAQTLVPYARPRLTLVKK